MKKLFTLFFAALMGATAIHAEVYSGTCGAEGDGSNLTWYLDTEVGKLVINGEGRMRNYANIRRPWEDYLTYIKTTYLSDSITYLSERCFANCTNLQYAHLPSQLTEVGNYTFQNNGKLEDVYIPTSVTTIGKYAFSNCTSLDSINLSWQLKEIKECAFQNCGMNYVWLGDSLQTIGYGAFYGSKLRSVTIAYGVTSLGKTAFTQCSYLKTVTIDSPFILNDDVYVKDYFGEQVKTYELGYDVRSIGRRAFDGCKNLETVILNSGLQTIGSMAFENCSSLREVSIPKTVRTIGDAAFGGCKNLTSIIIPEGVKSIGDRTFYGCTNLRDVWLPKSLETAGPETFWNCSSLPQIGNAIYADRDTMFLVQVTDSTLTSFSAMPAVKWVGRLAFKYCNHLTSIELPQGVRSIGWSALGERGFSYITCRAVTPPLLLDRYVITDEILDDTTIVLVPAEAVATYRAADGWKNYRYIVPIPGDWNPAHPQNPGYCRLTVLPGDSTQGYTTGSGLYTPGSTAHIAAYGNPGYGFVWWSDDSYDASRDIVLDKDCTIYAFFDTYEYEALFLNEKGDTLCLELFQYGDTARYFCEEPWKQETERYEYHFAGWYPELGTITQDTIFTAVFDSIFLGEETVHVYWEDSLRYLPAGRNSNVVVYQGGHLLIGEPQVIRSLTIYEDSMYFGQVSGIEWVQAQSMHMVQSFDAWGQGEAVRWFAFAVPFKVSVLSGITRYSENPYIVYGTDYVINEYDGALRAGTQDGWKRVEANAMLCPGKMYMIAFAAPDYYSLCFTANDVQSVADHDTIYVYSYPSAQGEHHSGWNGIANSCWTNRYAAMRDVEYITMYRNNAGVYYAYPLSQKLHPNDPFFVQVPEDSYVQFRGWYEPWMVVPRRNTMIDNNQPCVLTFSDEDERYTDAAYLTMQEGKENHYTIGPDLEKMQVVNAAVPQLWIEAYGMRLAAYAAPDVQTAMALHLGFYAPKEGYYKVAVSNLPKDKVVCLTADGNTYFDLSGENCVVPLTAGVNGHYGIAVYDAPEGVEHTKTNANAIKVLRDGQVLILRGNKVYTLTGQETK